MGNCPSLFISLTNYLDQAYSSEDSQCFSKNKTATVSPLTSSSLLTNKNISLQSKFFRQAYVQKLVLKPSIPVAMFNIAPTISGNDYDPFFSHVD